MGASGLKRRFGSGFRVMLHCEDERKADEFFKTEISSQAVLQSSLAGVINYKVGFDVKLSDMFSTMESKKELHGIFDWGVSNTTLEDVFLHITEKYQSEETGPPE